MGYSIIHAISQILLLFHDFLCSILIRRTARNIGIPTGFNTLILVLRKTYFSQIRVNPPRSPLQVPVFPISPTNYKLSCMTVLTPYCVSTSITHFSLQFCVQYCIDVEAVVVEINSIHSFIQTLPWTGQFISIIRLLCAGW